MVFVITLIKERIFPVGFISYLCVRICWPWAPLAFMACRDWSIFLILKKNAIFRVSFSNYCMHTLAEKCLLNGCHELAIGMCPFSHSYNLVSCMMIVICEYFILLAQWSLIIQFNYSVLLTSGQFAWNYHRKKK